MNQSQMRKKLYLNSDNRVKIYDLKSDSKSICEPNVQQNENTSSEILKISENIQNNQASADVQNSLVQKKLYKKTLSRIVFVQLIDSILSVESLKNELSTDSIVGKFFDLMSFIHENNFHECNFLQNKQLSNNFIYDLFLVFNQNYSKIKVMILESCKNHWGIYINESIYSSVIYAAITEFIYMEGKNLEKDHRKIILNEYLLISEYFVNENEIKFVNGILNTIFYRNADNKNVDVDNDILETGE
jgi:transcription termination factor NusB